MNIDKPSGLRIGSRLNEIQAAQEKTAKRLASGKRINTASEDPAGLAASTALEAATRGMNVQINNRQDEISLMQTAEGALSGIDEMLGRINELSVQAANGTLSDQDRANIQVEVDQLKQQIDMTANNTEFNSKKLLDGSLDIALQNGTPFKIGRMDAQTLGITPLDISTFDGAGPAISASARAIEQVTSERSRLGAVTNGVTSEISGLRETLLNSLSSLSQIADADMAREAVSFATGQVQSQAAIQAFRIDNTQRGRILELLNG